MKEKKKGFTEKCKEGQFQAGHMYKEKDGKITCLACTYKGKKEKRIFIKCSE